MSEKQKFIAKDIASWIFTILLAVFITYFITHLIIINTIVPSDSMESTILIGDRVITNRLAYVFNDVQRGDIIVFNAPDKSGTLYVKRVIGLPNEVVEIIEGDVYIDGELLDEKYVYSPILDKTRNSVYEVPEGSVFCMGDNRQFSIDARYWEDKYLNIDDILGKVVVRYFPSPKFVY